MGRTEAKFSDLICLTDRQREAWLATFTHRYVLYGGARGGGKSMFLRWWLVDFLAYQFSQGRAGVRVGLFCEDYPALRDRHISKMLVEFPQWMGELKVSVSEYHLAPKLGGGVIALRNLDDPSKYQSAEFAAVAVDELTRNSKDMFDVLRGSLRWPGIEHTVFVGATNPGGPGHLWVKQLWLDKDFPPELADRAKEFVFIKSLPKDNPHLSQSYWDELNSLPDNLRRAWVDGDWNVFAGQAFTTWKTDQHIIDPFPIPTHWPKWRGIDWGYAKPFACLWMTKNPDNGRHYLYRELYQAGLTDRQQAAAVREWSISETIQCTYADPSMWAAKNQQGIVSSTADEYGHEQIPLTQADNDRMEGKRKVDRLLLPLPDGKPGFQVFSSCRNFIRTFPALPYNTRGNVEDVDTEAEDHAYDALKYALTRTDTTPRPNKPKTKQTWQESKFL